MASIRDLDFTLFKKSSTQKHGIYNIHRSQGVRPTEMMQDDEQSIVTRKIFRYLFISLLINPQKIHLIQEFCNKVSYIGWYTFTYFCTILEAEGTGILWFWKQASSCFPCELPLSQCVITLLGRTSSLVSPSKESYPLI